MGEISMHEFDAKRAADLEAASIQASDDAIKALLLLNGGACIALLGFIANVFNAQGLSQARAAFLNSAVHSLAFFALGAGMAVLTTFAAYLTNQKYSSGIRHAKPYQNGFWIAGQALNYIAILFAILSLGLFAWGVITIWYAVPAGASL